MTVPEIARFVWKRHRRDGVSVGEIAFAVTPFLMGETKLVEETRSLIVEVGPAGVSLRGKRTQDEAKVIRWDAIIATSGVSLRTATKIPPETAAKRRRKR